MVLVVTLTVTAVIAIATDVKGLSHVSFQTGYM